MLENEHGLALEDEIRAGLLDDLAASCGRASSAAASDGHPARAASRSAAAPQQHRKLRTEGDRDPLRVMDWVTLYALAVNEENAAGGRW